MVGWLYWGLVTGNRLFEPLNDNQRRWKNSSNYIIALLLDKCHRLFGLLLRWAKMAIVKANRRRIEELQSLGTFFVENFPPTHSNFRPLTVISIFF